jgi:hypothetical protein
MECFTKAVHKLYGTVDSFEKGEFLKDYPNREGKGFA